MQDGPVPGLLWFQGSEKRVTKIIKLSDDINEKIDIDAKVDFGDAAETGTSLLCFETGRVPRPTRPSRRGCTTPLVSPRGRFHRPLKIMIFLYFLSTDTCDSPSGNQGRYPRIRVRERAVTHRLI